MTVVSMTAILTDNRTRWMMRSSYYLLVRKEGKVSKFIIEVYYKFRSWKLKFKKLKRDLESNKKLFFLPVLK